MSDSFTNKVVRGFAEEAIKKQLLDLMARFGLDQEVFEIAIISQAELANAQMHKIGLSLTDNEGHREALEHEGLFDLERLHTQQAFDEQKESFVAATSFPFVVTFELTTDDFETQLKAEAFFNHLKNYAVSEEVQFDAKENTEVDNPVLSAASLDALRRALILAVNKAPIERGAPS